jgi:hypothetical protein
MSKQEFSKRTEAGFRLKWEGSKGSGEEIEEEDNEEVVAVGSE